MLMLVIIYQIALFVGFVIGGNTFNKNKNRKKEIYDLKKINNIITCALLMSCFFSICWFYKYTESYSPSVWINSIYKGISQPGDAYKYNLYLSENGGYSSGLITMISTLLVGFYYIGIPLGMYVFGSLKKYNKLLFIFTVLLELSSYVMRGTNIGIFRVALSLACVYFIKGKYHLRKNRKLLSTIVLMLAVLYFIESTTGRMYVAMPSTILDLKVDMNRGLGSLLPANVQYAYLMITSYISQGYQGMAYALEYPFTTTFGLGNSTFLMEKIPSLFEMKLYDRTYISKISGVWSDRINWSTAYTWIANDVGFVGVIVVMFILGFIFCKVFHDAKNKNLYAVLMLLMYAQLFLFLPCNNSVLANPNTFMPFIFLHILWLLDRHNVAIKVHDKSIWKGGLAHAN